MLLKYRTGRASASASLFQYEMSLNGGMYF